MTDLKRYISTTTMSMATKLGRVATYHEEVPPIMLHDPLVTWTWKLTLETENITSPLPE